MTAPSIDLSIVIPVKNEEGNIGPLISELAGVAEKLGSYEIIVIDDGSTDGTWARLKAVRAETPTLHPVKFDRNYGQSSAFWTGFKRARGRILITMDGDMQNDPHDIPLLLAELQKGADACLTWRTKRQDNWSRRMQSKIGNGMRNWLLSSDIRDTGSQLRAFYAYCLDDLPHFEGMHRFLGNLFIQRGYTIVQIPTNHRSRHSGTAKYGVGNRALRGLKDLFGVRWLGKRMIRGKVEAEL